MSKLTDVDAALMRWTDRFNERQTKRALARSITGLPVRRGGQSKLTTPSEVRRRLRGIVQRRPQVMVKISGGGRGMRPIRAHLNYISRNGQLPVETQDGERIVGHGDLATLAGEWQMGGFPIGENSNRREAFNIVLSMPAGTDAVALHRAARDFAKNEFSNYQYALVLHTLENDPNRNPSENPHVHLCVKTRGIDGVRLNPRKSDLRRWREQFAECLREHGVEAEATSRSARFQPVPGKRQAVYHQSPGNGIETNLGASDRKRGIVKAISDTEKNMLKGYSELARALAGSTTEADRDLAVAIVRNMKRIDDPILHRDVVAERPIER